METQKLRNSETQKVRNSETPKRPRGPDSGSEDSGSEAGSKRYKVLQDLTRVGRDVRDPVRPGDPAIGVDQVGPPLGEVGRRLLRSALGFVALTDASVLIGEQEEREALLLRETPVVFGGIEGDAQDLRTPRREFGGSITEPLSLRRSTLRVCLGEPPEHDPATPKA